MLPEAATPSLAAHLARGVLGVGCLIAALALGGVVGPAALLLLVPGLVALGGCPTCWTVELAAKLSAGRTRRSCAEGRCALTPVDHRPAARPERGKAPCR